MTRRSVVTPIHAASATDEPWALGQVPPWDQEAERNILGAAMLAEPMPPWLEPKHFFPTQHQRIFDAVLSVGGNVSRVNCWLRESAPKFGPLLVKSTELAEMCLEAEHARRMGWALDFDGMREQWRRRELLDCMTRQAILLRHGQASHADCIEALRAHVKAVK